jgi:cell division protease FtsH
MADNNINSNDLLPEEKQNKNRKPKGPNLPKFNFYWIYGIVAVAFLAIQFMPHDVAIKTTWFDVKNDMLLGHDVQKITVVNKERAEIYLKKEALKNEKYKGLKDRGIFGDEIGPHYYFEIGDVQQFADDLREAEKTFPENERVSVEYITQRNYFSDILISILPFILLIGVWMFFMRRMGGGSGEKSPDRQPQSGPDGARHLFRRAGLALPLSLAPTPGRSGGRGLRRTRPPLAANPEPCRCHGGGCLLRNPSG